MFLYFFSILPAGTYHHTGCVGGNPTVGLVHRPSVFITGLCNLKLKTDGQTSPVVCCQKYLDGIFEIKLDLLCLSPPGRRVVVVPVSPSRVPGARLSCLVLGVDCVSSRALSSQYRAGHHQHQMDSHRLSPASVLPLTQLSPINWRVIGFNISPDIIFIHSVGWLPSRHYYSINLIIWLFKVKFEQGGEIIGHYYSVIKGLSPLYQFSFQTSNLLTDWSLDRYKDRGVRVKWEYGTVQV